MIKIITAALLSLLLFASCVSQDHDDYNNKSNHDDKNFEYLREKFNVKIIL